MGTTLTPYAIELKKLRATLGSKDERLVAALRRRFADELDEIDELAEGGEEEDDEEDNCDTTAEGLDRLSELLHAAEKQMRKGESLQKIWDKLDRDRNTPADLKPVLRSLILDEDPPEDDEEGEPACTTAAEVLGHLICGGKPDRRASFKYGHVLELLCRHFGKKLPNRRWCSLRLGSEWFARLNRELKSASIPPKTISLKQLVDRGPPVPLPKCKSLPSIGYLEIAELKSALTALSKARLDKLDREARPYLEDLRQWLTRCIAGKTDLVCFYS